MIVVVVVVLLVQVVGASGRPGGCGRRGRRGARIRRGVRGGPALFVMAVVVFGIDRRGRASVVCHCLGIYAGKKMVSKFSVLFVGLHDGAIRFISVF